jgi:hypothetical protein
MHPISSKALSLGEHYPPVGNVMIGVYGLLRMVCMYYLGTMVGKHSIQSISQFYPGVHHGCGQAVHINHGNFLRGG